ncbi:MAG: hypothetical protein JXA13_12745 [Anaerolineales bacterium]|nr:hypothetical protein [Anaerolineales bacterium]
MSVALPDLQIVPVSRIILHEDHDLQRTLPLIDKLRAQGILRNPPLVMPLEDSTERYMVLDGANRVTALQEMEFPHIVAQVIAPDNPKMHLDTWRHVVWGIDSEDLLKNIREVGGLKLADAPKGKKKYLKPDYLPVEIQLADGRNFLACSAGKGLELMAYLHGIVNSYKDKSYLDRTSQTDIEFFRSVHKNLTALFIYPNFSIRDLLQQASEGNLLPSGLTRFTVSPRALHLNYPLHELSSAKPIEYKNKYLKRWIQECVQKKCVRYYAEETFLFDD